MASQNIVLNILHCVSLAVVFDFSPFFNFQVWQIRSLLRCNVQSSKIFVHGFVVYLVCNPITEAVANVILPTFEALSEESLLSKCMHGGRQNQNESINGLIWQRATKETHSSFPTVETATFLGVAHFNDGSVSLLSVLKQLVKQLGIVPGVHCMKACRKLDGDRIRHSHRKSGEAAKKRRKQLRKWKKGH